MKKYFLLLLLLLSQLSCIKKEDKKLPDNIMTHKQMVEVLVDVHLVEASLSNKRCNSKTLKSYSNYYYNFIFKKHHITRKKYEESLNYYKLHLKKLDKIYADVITNLSKKQSEVNHE